MQILSRVNCEVADELNMALSAITPMLQVHSAVETWQCKEVHPIYLTFTS